MELAVFKFQVENFLGNIKMILCLTDILNFPTISAKNTLNVDFLLFFIVIYNSIKLSI